MSIRLRLALWYGSLFAAVLFLVALLSYAFHTRAHYDDMDRMLVSSVGHIASDALLTGEPHLVDGEEGMEVSFRLYRADGQLLEGATSSHMPPPVDPRVVLAAPAGPAFDALARIAPPLAGPPPTSSDGVFGLVTTADQRWRLYVVPLNGEGSVRGYIEAVAPLGRLDESVRRLRDLLLGLGVFGLVAALLGSWAVAGRALAPINDMVQTARTIERGRDLSQRVVIPASRDELGRLAETLNEMLASLEDAYQTQQRFVADASHELRAPLTAIQGNLELLRRQRSMSEAEREEALGEAEREAARLTRLVADLLALARADAGATLKCGVVDLDVIVLDALSSARQLTHGQHLDLDPFEPVQALGDEDRLKQALLILLDNAVKYTPADGRVTLGLRRVNGVAEVTVRDTGVGIPASALPHVFERFYRADPARARDPSGAGLGLSIARWIVEQHGGAISLASQPGGGTTATIQLPVHATGD